MPLKRIYRFAERCPGARRLLGGKGAGLGEMTGLGLPVPPGFVITTEVCKEFYSLGQRLPTRLMADVRRAMGYLERSSRKRFGDPSNPLLVSVRSGAAISMPGMMDTILNLGLNDPSVAGLVKQTGDERFAYDAYRRFIQMFGKVVLGIDEELFVAEMNEVKKERRIELDTDLSSASLKELVNRYKGIVKQASGKDFPSDPYTQLEIAIGAVFKSWNGRRCVEYRRQFRVTPAIADGTAVTIVAMVFGNLGSDSATGVAFTRDPSTGEKRLYGEYLTNAQGEDVVAGVRTPKPIAELEREMPSTYRQLLAIRRRLERAYREPQDFEFTIERGRMYLLQTRAAKMNSLALVKTSTDMAEENLISRNEAILRIETEQLDQLLHIQVDPMAKAKPIAQGLAASPGAASGKVVFDPDLAESLGRKGEKVLLVREETKPEDVHGFFASQGILTSRGGKTSHAAVVARGMGKPCVVGCAEIEIDLQTRKFKAGQILVKEGDVITIDGTFGRVFMGEVPTIQPGLPPELSTLLSWADEMRRLGVRANADTPENAALARKFGAEGIGLCRTERMFNAIDRLPLVRRMILAENSAERLEWLDKLKPLQKGDFKEILKAMSGFPVTIRLLDPPLHEFLPTPNDLETKNASLTDSDEKELAKKLLDKAKALSETNPMLGHRGVRLGISYPEIYEMQIRAICEAAAELLLERIDVKPQIMVPQVCAPEELKAVQESYKKIKGDVERAYGVKLPIKYGTMIEVVRACLVADEIAGLVDFFSFGTNDLTQGTYSFSREDAENKFLHIYTTHNILSANPFQTLDPKGVGRLMEICVRLGRRANGRLEIGICGEHGGDPASIEICHKTDLTYVSCSPYRIPIARLAAAQSALRSGKKVLMHRGTR